MNALVEVTCELDRLRKIKTEQHDHLSDEDYWSLCRLALGVKQTMPRDEIVRRIAFLVDQSQSR